MRKRIFEIIELSNGDNLASTVYDLLMIVAICVSILPMAFKSPDPFFVYTDMTTAAIFVVDYILRLLTADYKLHRGPVSFIRYPFTVWAIIDLLSILPSITVLHSGFKLLRILRIVRTFRVFRVFKAFRYSKSVIIIANVVKNSKDALIAVIKFQLKILLIMGFCVELDTCLCCRERVLDEEMYFSSASV